ncbi:MAG: DUF695 domain-containing protein [bacterium]|nr:DUF695 domain-containing protein [bacterium]
MVDDAPASILLDLALVRQAPIANEGTLYALHIAMSDLDHHGMGSHAEAEVLWPIDDAIAAAAKECGVRYVGRLRNRGTWQMTFMGPAEQGDALEQIAVRALRPVGRTFETTVKADPEWSYYRDFLYPNAERRAWMSDYKVVEQLQKEGDPLTAERRVDHWIYFARAADRDTFLGESRKLGFDGDHAEGLDEPERSHGLQIHRVDHVDLGSIHEVVVTLMRLAETHAGDCDGWKTQVVK